MSKPRRSSDSYPTAPSTAPSQIPETTPSHKPTLAVVATAHLDTQWRWTIRRTITEFLPSTLRENFKLLDSFPGYTFSFEGAFRYLLAQEYYPEEFERMRRYIREGRWRVTGSWLDAVDVNIPSFESLIRHALYGNGYFKREFGRTSRDIFLPDCFGFGYALPAIAAHCGLKCFSTQKLTWGGCAPAPFDIGLWEGVDGSAIIAAIRPGEYVTTIDSDLSCDEDWIERAARQGEQSDLFAAYMYFGVGDQGGAPTSEAVAWLQRSFEGDGPLNVCSIGADELVELAGLNPDADLPRYNGELLLTRHGIGCYTSQAAMKRWNRKNELLADAAERAAVTGTLLRGMTYPREDLRDAWTRFLWHQFHDDLTGTSIPEAYEFSWNDEILSLNRFSSILEHAVGATTPALDTRAKGVPLAVYNPLGIDREDAVEATVRFDTPAPAVRVFGPNGREVPAQILRTDGNAMTVAFIAHVPANGYAIYDIRPSKEPSDLFTPVAASDRSIENDRYKVALNSMGQVASVYDKKHHRELLAAPIALELLHDVPAKWPAWEIEYTDLRRTPRAIVGDRTGTTRMRMIECGPARSAIEVTQHHGDSTFRTIIRLASGEAGDRLEFVTDIDWYECETLLKAAFHFATPNNDATYDLGLGAITRGVNTPQMYEVPGHQWADLTADDGHYGISVLNDSRYGWDHPDRHTLRLTLLHTPGIAEKSSDMADERSQDLGHHTLTYAISGHPGGWRDGATAWQAARLNQPLIPFQVPKHKGSFGKTHSLCRILADDRETDRSDQACINSIKLSEDSDEIIIRIRELHGRDANGLVLAFAWPIESAREVDGCEEPRGIARVDNGLLRFNLTPYQPKAFAVRLAKPSVSIPRPSTQPIDLPYNLNGVTRDGAFTEADFDSHGNSLAAELLPETLLHRDIPFTFGPTSPGACNVVRCEGQTISLPEGDFDKLHILATAIDGPTEAIFAIDGNPVSTWVQDYVTPLAQWDNRLRGGRLFETPDMITPAYINRRPVAWYGTHRHTPTGNDPYRFIYVYLLSFDLPSDARQLTLPNNPRLRILAATVADTPHDTAVPARLLYDEADGAVVTVNIDRYHFLDQTTIRLSSPTPAADIRYTTDGSNPTAHSPRYQTPITMNRTGVVRAAAFTPGNPDPYITSIPVTRLVPKSPCPVSVNTPGLHCRYYEGSWRQLPDFETLSPILETTLETIGVPRFTRDEDWGILLTGYVRIPADGVYDFYLASDDGSTLTIANTLLIDNDGIHGAREKHGEIALKAGLHPIRIAMFNAQEASLLKLAWRGPDFDKEPLPPQHLLHAAVFGD